LKSFAQMVARARILGQRLLSPGNTLSHRVVHAGFWAFSLKIIDRLFGLARTIILARLLSPNDFGLFGIALLALSALESFFQTGFDAALIQSKKDIKSYLNTAWTVQILRGVVLALILAAIAPLVATFFNEPQAAILLQVLASVQLINGFTNIGIVFFQKRLNFYKQFVYVFSGTLADLLVAISAALFLRNAWALAYGYLAGALAKLVSSYILSSEKPRFQLIGPQVRELFSYGKWLLGVSILAFWGAQGDRIIIGKLIGTAALGLYQIASQLVRLPTIEISKDIIGTVTFPTLAAINDNKQLAKVFFYVMEVNALLILPLGAVLLLLADLIVSVLLGQQWMSAVPAIRLLVVAGLLTGFREVDIRMYMALGSPKYPFWLSLGRVALSVLLAISLISFLGLIGAALAELATSIALFIMAIFISSKKLHIPKQAYFRPFFPGLCATSVATFIAFVFQELVHLTSALKLLTTGTVFLLLYSLCVYLELRLGWVRSLAVIIRSVREKYSGGIS